MKNKRFQYGKGEIKVKILIESLHDLSADSLVDYHPIGGNICGIIWNHKSNDVRHSV